MRVGAVDRAQRLARGAESEVAGPRLRVMRTRKQKGAFGPIFFRARENLLRDAYILGAAAPLSSFDWRCCC